MKFCSRNPMAFPIAIAIALGLAGNSLAAAAWAQELEPGVQTSTSAKPAPPKQDPTSVASAPRASPPAAKPKAAAQPAATSAPAGKGSDKIQLDTTQISGNRELPKVMYVVPWRRADPGDFSGRPPNSLLDEALTPVDRDVFRRTNRYYGAVQDSAQSSKSQAGAADAGSGALSPRDEK
jgi:hypothetical protein